MTTSSSYIHSFAKRIDAIPLPEAFTFPFFYEPHPLALLAMQQLQDYLKVQQDFAHNFGLEQHADLPPIGKMFGVLVVQDAQEKLGFIAAFSGKLANSNEHSYFVPPVYDLLKSGSFFLQEEENINRLNAELAACINAEELQQLRMATEASIQKRETELAALRTLHKQYKRDRKSIRDNSLPSDPAQKAFVLEDLVKQSYRDQYEYNKRKAELNNEVEALQHQLNQHLAHINALKEERKTRSAHLQRRIFEQYNFLNAEGKSENVWNIFQRTLGVDPPAGSGECAAPKLLQFAYKNNLKPVCMAEFWWGASPQSEVRKHGYTYPACRGKCEPILGHMLKGMTIDPNPLLQAEETSGKLDILFEDDDILVVNKPAELLSVPGIHLKDSVYERAKRLRPDMTGPIIIHRLDMSTSGIIVLAKNKSAHQFIQAQFITHQVKKRYTALLDGVISQKSGTIDLPLRVDLEDRPRQVVCYEYGKPARTQFDVVEVKNGKTKIYYYPLTGRTHQLRVHSAHQSGLGTPIWGDDLYGKKADRLHLHAGYIYFTHPTTREPIEFTSNAPF